MRHRLPQVLGLLALIAGAARGAEAAEPPQASPYLCKEWQIEDGLPQSSIRTIAQTAAGYLWISTFNEGPARFDGVKFTRLADLCPEYARRFNRENTANALLADPDGGLWIGLNDAGLAHWKEGRLTVFTVAEGLPDNTVRALCRAADGTLWVGTAGGLSRLRRGGRRIDREAPGPAGVCVTALLADADGSLWVGTAGAGLHRLAAGAWSSYRAGGPEGLSCDSVEALHRDRKGDLWVGTQWGLDRLRDGRFTVFHAGEGALPYHHILAVLEDRHGTLWVGTRHGVALGRDGVFTRFPSLEGFANRPTYGIAADREGSIWIATIAGLCQVHERRVEVLGRDEGLSDDTITSVCDAGDGGVWIGTDNASPVLRRRDGRLEALPGGGALAACSTTTVRVDRHGALWVGTWGGGLFRFEGGRVTVYRKADGLADDVIRALYQDRAGDLWIGTWSGGISRLHDGRFTTYDRKDGLPNLRVRAFLEDRNGRMWVATNGGLGRFEGGRFVTYTRKDGLPSDSIFSLHEDGEGSLWIGTTDAGLVRRKGGRFTVFTARDGLPSDSISQIIEDNRGDFWLGSTRGIFRVQRRQFDDFAAGRTTSIIPISLGRDEGLRATQCTSGAQPAGCRTADGKLWFPTLSGLVVVDPARFPTNTVIPPAVIERVLVDGEAVDDPADPLRRPGRGKLEFHYTANSFRDTAEVRFRYRLEGFDDHWIDAGPRRVAFYTNVPPGKYRFRVKACNGDGLWAESGAGVDVLLAPGIYQTGAFRVFCLAVALIAGYLACRVRIRTVEARERELERLVEERTDELRAARDELELHNGRLAELAATDGLTGLKNRRHFHEALESALEFARRQGLPLSVVLLDVDRFKQYNDDFGHPAGDEVLRDLAGILLANARGHDLAARYGGEEFVLLLPATGADDSATIVERLRAAIEAAPWSLRTVTASFGVVTCRGGDATPSQLIGDADRALYLSKHRGRNRVTHHDEIGVPNTVCAAAR